MTIKEANLKIGDKFHYEKSEGIWIVCGIVERGIIAKHSGIKGFMAKTNTPYWIVVPGSHKHLGEWHLEIEKI